MQVKKEWSEMHQQWCIQLHDCTKEQAETVRAIVLNNWTTDPDYWLAKNCGAFLQGYVVEDNHSWVLIEFWKNDAGAIQKFIDRVNEALRELG